MVLTRMHTHAKRSTRGFTLIEMMVVTGVIVLVSTVVFANNTRFGGQVLLRNLAYDIALSIRQAQVYGISVERFDPTGTFAPAYGIRFAASSPGAFVTYADVLSPQNGLYDCPNPGTVNCELVTATSVLSGYKIKSLCATPSSGAEVCNLSTIDVTFQRPEPDAYIRAPELPGINQSARIIISSPRGDERSIVIELNGQIAVQ